MPTDFQESIRGEFPLYDQKQSKTNNVRLNASGLPESITSSCFKNHQFITADGFCKVSLTSSNITISTLNYVGWDDFSAKVKFVIESFVKFYKPSFFNNAILKYINVIEPKQIGISHNWSDYFVSNIVSVLDEASTKTFKLEYETKDEEKSIIEKKVIGIGLVNNDPNECLILNLDYIYQNKIDINLVKDVLDNLHCNAVSYFESIIKDKYREVIK